MQPLRICVDVHERHSRIPQMLTSLGARIELRSLTAGDYEVGSRVLVERKTVRDLHLTLVNGRFWRQVRRLRQNATWPVLLIEGAHLADGPVRADAVRGTCIAAIEQGIAVLRSESKEDSDRWLIRLSHRVQERKHRYRPRFAQIPKSPDDDVRASVLSAIPGISAVTAHALLERFGSVAGIAAAQRDEWLSVPGVGKRRGLALANALHSASPSPSARSGEGPDPST